ncbi:MAG TPA: hypothetical protein DGO43_00970 [Chloroflexi bacterium]|nr:hypothetical protein [Chloroflexota bacterium]
MLEAFFFAVGEIVYGLTIGIARNISWPLKWWIKPRKKAGNIQVSTSTRTETSLSSQSKQ